MTHNDIHHMRHALRLAERQLGRTWPNPSVGALIVKEGKLLAQGVTARGGRPHAETQALAQAGDEARGATLYVTLEPCAHQGNTPPCVDAIIKAGIIKVAAGCTDANPEVSGKGFARLRETGMEVIAPVCEKEAKALNEGFFSKIERGRPFVTLKIAASLDGKIADAQGKSQSITDDVSRRRVHLLRARHDAIMTGIGTVLADDPQLNCRLLGLEENSPQRVVVDSSLRIASSAKILPAWIFTSHKATSAEKKKITQLEKSGASVYPVAQEEGRLSLKAILEKLAQLGITRLMVEAGSMLASAMMRQELVDRLYWFTAPLVMGGNALPALRDTDTLPFAGMPRFSLQGQERHGPDILSIYDIRSQ